MEEYLNKATPQWFKHITESAREHRRNVFILHFNIRDLVFDPAVPPSHPSKLLTLTEFLNRLGAGNRTLALYYTLHEGIQIFGGKDNSENRHIKARQPRELWEELAQNVSAFPYPLRSMHGQASDENTPPQFWRDPELAIPLLTRALAGKYSFPGTTTATSEADSTQNPATPPRKPIEIGLIIDYLHHLAPPPAVVTAHKVAPIVQSLLQWSTEPTFTDHRHRVILLTPELAAIHPELTASDSRITAIRILRPTRDERAAFLQWLSTFPEYSRLNTSRQIEGTTLTLVQDIANGTAGMNYVELRDFANNIQRNSDANWRTELAQRRMDIVQRESGGLLVPKESKFGLNDVAGYRYAKEEIMRQLPRLRDGRGDVAGILFTGPPGTGKSFFAGALARDVAVPVVTMRRLRSMWVGESERNFERVLEVARSLAPVIIFVDEVDQAFANRQQQQGDSGVEQRLLGRLLEFMDDKENLGKVLWIAASNRPDLLDDALLSRFRLRVPFLLPDREACHVLLKEQLPSQVGIQWKADSWNATLEQLIDDKVVSEYSGRELETIVRSAMWYEEDHRFEEAQGKELPPLPPGPRVLDTLYLEKAIKSSSVGHNHHEYLRQALLALQSVQRETPALIEAVQTALPRAIVHKILEENRLDKEAIRRELSKIDQDLRLGMRI